jgi:hypothetical protein
VETSRKSALDVAKNVLDEGKVRVLRVVHEEAHLLNCIGQVWAGESKVLYVPARLWYSDRLVTRAHL